MCIYIHTRVYVSLNIFIFVWIYRDMHYLETEMLRTFHVVGDVSPFPDPSHVILSFAQVFMGNRTTFCRWTGPSFVVE